MLTVRNYRLYPSVEHLIYILDKTKVQIHHGKSD
jgi:hypothetical protein